MKFHELKEGKKYRIDRFATTYRVKNMILQSCSNEALGMWKTSILTMEQIEESNFIEIPQYVTFDKAIEHMKEGKRVKFYNGEYYLNYQEVLCISHCGGCSFRAEMLEPKWILL